MRNTGKDQSCVKFRDLNEIPHLVMQVGGVSTNSACDTISGNRVIFSPHVCPTSWPGLGGAETAMERAKTLHVVVFANKPRRSSHCRDVSSTLDEIQCMNQILVR